MPGSLLFASGARQRNSRLRVLFVLCLPVNKPVNKLPYEQSNLSSNLEVHTEFSGKTTYMDFNSLYMFSIALSCQVIVVV